MEITSANQAQSLTTPFTHFVFVDFENVPEIDLGLVEGRPVKVTLLIGKNQTRLDLALVRQIHRLATQVELVEVGASGHNALDLTLACYLGQAIQRAPDASFHIVSKDKDFEPMVAHLKNKGYKIALHESFATPAPTKPPTLLKPVVTPKSVPPVKPSKTDDKFIKLLTHLKLNHPKTQATLLRSIATYYGNKLSSTEVTKILEALKNRNFLSVDAANKVTYL